MYFNDWFIIENHGWNLGFLLMAFDLYDEDSGPIGTFRISADKGQNLNCRGISQVSGN